MGTGNKVEFLVAICALITSMVAVFIAWDQSRVMRTQQRAAVWPILQIDQINDANDREVTYTLQVENAGVGPAQIETFMVALPGRGTSDQISDFINYMRPPEVAPDNISTTSLERRVVRQGQAFNVFQLSWNDTEVMPTTMLNRVEHFQSGASKPAVLFMCYCSILDECWISSSENQGSSEPVRSCSAINEIASKYAMQASEPTDEEGKSVK
jgi:hypothetical protein